MALAKFTNDSMASDNKATESVNHHAKVFSAMVASATSTDSLSKFLGVFQLTRSLLMSDLKPSN
jgi:hypothetical protein